MQAVPSAAGGDSSGQAGLVPVARVKEDKKKKDCNATFCSKIVFFFFFAVLHSDICIYTKKMVSTAT